MSLVRRTLRRPLSAFGTPAVAIRFLLGVAAACILAYGLFRHPEIATTNGERVAGLILTLAVATEILISAAFFPMGIRKAR